MNVSGDSDQLRFQVNKDTPSLLQLPGLGNVKQEFVSLAEVISEPVDLQLPEMVGFPEPLGKNHALSCISVNWNKHLVEVCPFFCDVNITLYCRLLT